MKLTQAIVNKLALPAGKSEASFSDDDQPGLSIRLRAGRRSHYFMRYRAGGVQHRLDLGDTGKVLLSEARRLAGRHAVKIVEKENPAEQRHKAAEAADNRFSSAVNGKKVDGKEALQGGYINWLIDNRKPATVDAARRYLNKHFASFHRYSITGIDRNLVSAAIKRIAAENGLIASNRARANLSSFFNWAIGEGLCDVNPVHGTNKAKDEEQSRERKLTRAEIKTIWANLPESNTEGGYGDIVRLLILTGQRRDEIGGLTWTESNFGKKLIELPKERTKNGLPHDVPLSDPALTILKAIKKRDGIDFVFGRYSGKFSGWSKAKAALDKKVKIPHWTLHDLRRTASTVMNEELDIQDKHVEAVLNHISGKKAGVAGVYNKAEYNQQKRDALDKYAAWVLKAVR